MPRLQEGAGCHLLGGGFFGSLLVPCCCVRGKASDHREPASCVRPGLRREEEEEEEAGPWWLRPSPVLVWVAVSCVPQPG